MGTVGYMSPEQVRGEKLDARTDVFSFGLVLYEMAVGQRAFTGETAAILHEAILHEVPTPVRELNPSVPSKLEGIINKAVEKDRSGRYEAAKQIQSDLELLRRKIQRRHWTLWLRAACGVVLLLIATGVFVLGKRHPLSRLVPPGIKLRQLTANSVENHVRSAAISPGGKRLAYSDTKGLHVKLIESGETQDLEPSNALVDKNVEWECIAWSRDGTRLVANAYRGGIPNWYSPGGSIWTLPLFDGSARKLRDDAAAFSVSSEESQISFGTHKGRFGEREIWLMGPAGEQPRKLFETDENSAIGSNTWSPDGKRILYPQINETGYTLVSRDIETSLTNHIPTFRDAGNQSDLLADRRASDLCKE